MLSVLLLPLALPGAVAWRADGWLTQEVIGGERLALGDEFGCHGMPGKNVYDDTAVITECKDYLTSQITILIDQLPSKFFEFIHINGLHSAVER